MCFLYVKKEKKTKHLISLYMFWILYIYSYHLTFALLKLPLTWQWPNMNKLVYSIFCPDSTAPLPSQRRSCTATSMTPTIKRSTAAALTCDCVPTVWPCKMPRPRWRCSSSSAAACPRWLCPPLSTVITWSRPRPEESRIWPEQR